MHVVMVCPAAGGSGSVANVALHHARELSREFQVTLMSDSFPEAREDGFSSLKPVLIEPVRFGWLRRFAHVPNEVAFAFAVRSAIAKVHRRQPVSIVICHGHSVATLAARALRDKLQIPYGLVTHGDIFDRPRGTYDPRLTWFYQRMTPVAYRDADLVIALSPHMAAMAIKGGANKKKVELIPNGIDPAEIGLDSPLLKSRCRVTEYLELLYVGRLSTEKGVDILIEAAAVLKARGMPFRLRIAGTGVSALCLQSLVSKLQLGDVIEFIGPIPRTGLGELYQSADVVCVPSRSEPFGLVILEAMAAGTAVLGTNVGGIPYIVNDGVTGVLCAPNNPVAMADALGRLVSEVGAIQRLGTAGHQHVMREFTWEHVGRLLSSALLAATGP